MHGKHRERHKRKTHLSISGERKRHRFQIGGGTFNCLEEGRREEDSFIAGWKSSGEFITHAGVELAIRALAYVPLFSLSLRNAIILSLLKRVVRLVSSHALRVDCSNCLRWGNSAYSVAQLL